MSLEQLGFEPTASPGATATDAGRAPSETPALGPGAVLAHFRIDGLAGKGGMGEVYRATDLALDRPVALKVLPASAADDPGRRERMIREARAQARIVDPHVCHIYYVGEERGLLFFAMEYVPGETLAEKLARGPLAPTDAIELVRQAALGLREAHAQGFTHRDVKPSNLMVDAHGEIKLVDFGLVTRGPGPTGGDASATTAVGTPLYMAPEQGRGVEVDFRADIYALGATLHHLIAGRPPFAGDTIAELRSQHESALRPAIAASGRRGQVLVQIDQLCARMMAKRPEDRFASYDQLIAELERVSPIRARPAGFFVRGFAALIDFIIAALASVPIQLVLPDLNRHAILWMCIVAYHTIATARWGRTVGRALLEIEVVSASSGRPPPVARAALRFVLEYGPVATVAILEEGNVRDRLATDLDAGGTFASIATLAGILVMMWAAWRRYDKRALWDLAAGTEERYRRVARR